MGFIGAGTEYLESAKVWGTRCSFSGCKRPTLNVADLGMSRWAGPGMKGSQNAIGEQMVDSELKAIRGRLTHFWTAGRLRGPSVSSDLERILGDFLISANSPSNRGPYKDDAARLSIRAPNGRVKRKIEVAQAAFWGRIPRYSHAFGAATRSSWEENFSNSVLRASVSPW
jgi:hypothetical protein